MYYVAATGNENILAIIDMNTGARKNIITLKGGILDSTPVITGDRCSFVVKNKNDNSRRGMIYRVPQGTFITDFRVG